MRKKQVKVIKNDIKFSKEHETQVNDFLAQDIEIVKFKTMISHGYGSEPRFMRDSIIITVIIYIRVI